jgi:hypothetical protein
MLDVVLDVTIRSMIFSSKICCVYSITKTSIEHDVNNFQAEIKIKTNKKRETPLCNSYPE